MMWLPVGITLVVMLIVAAAFLSQGRSNWDLGDLSLVMVISVYVTGLSIGFLVTAFASPTLETWPWAIGVRAAWQLGGTLLVLAHIWRSKGMSWRRGGRPAWVLAGIASALGLAAAYNPVRDLVAGPAVLRVTDFDVAHVRAVYRRGGPGESIFATMQASSPDGRPRTLDLAGWGANTAEEMLGQCESPVGATVTVLAHVERVLEVRCPDGANE